MKAVDFIISGLSEIDAPDLHKLQHAITAQLKKGLRREVVQRLRDNKYKQANVFVRNRMQWSNEQAKEYVDAIKARYENL